MRRIPILLWLFKDDHDSKVEPLNKAIISQHYIWFPPSTHEIETVFTHEYAQTHCDAHLSHSCPLLSQPWFLPSPLRKLTVNIGPTITRTYRILSCMDQISPGTEVFLQASKRSIYCLLQRIHGTLFALVMSILSSIGTSIIRKPEHTLLGDVLLGRLRISAIKWISLNKSHIYPTGKIKLPSVPIERGGNWLQEVNLFT